MEFSCNEKPGYDLKYNILERLQKVFCNQGENADKNLRREIKLLAYACNVSEPAVKQWMVLSADQGREIPLTKLEVIAHYFSCSVNDLRNTPAVVVDFEAIRKGLKVA